MNLRSKIEAINEEFDERYYGKVNTLSDADLWKFCRSIEVKEIVSDIVRQHLLSLAQEIAEALTPERMGTVTSAEIDDKVIGFNRCREEINRRKQILLGTNE